MTDYFAGVQVFKLIYSPKESLFNLKEEFRGVLVTFLGTGANGGIPQWDCCCPNCSKARTDPSLRRTRSSIAVTVDGIRHVLIDAGPDLKVQLEQVGLVPNPSDAGPTYRQSKVDAILLTHGHGDHTVGVAEFSTGKSYGIPVYAPRDLIEFLFGGGDKINYFGELGRLAKDYVKPHALEQNKHLELLDGLRVEGFQVEHTDKLGDGRYYPSSTFGYELEKDGKRLLYAPDLGQLPDSLLRRADGADVFILDATFWGDDELRISGIKKTSYDLGHVPVEESLEVLKDADIGRVIYTHINHTNPLTDPHSVFSRRVRDAGFEIAYDGMRISL